MSNYCNTCQHYKVTHDGPHCFRGKIKPVSPIAVGDCWEPVTEKPQVATKTCPHCGRELPVSAFGRHAKTKDGYQPLCRKCRSAEMKGKMQNKNGQDDKHHLPFGRRPKHPSYVDENTGVTMKWCRLCQQFKPITDFHINKTSKDGHASECKACHNARTVECQRKRNAAKKAQEEALKSKVLPGDVEIVNDLFIPERPTVTLKAATDTQIIEELRARGFHGTLTMEV